MITDKPIAAPSDMMLINGNAASLLPPTTFADVWAGCFAAVVEAFFGAGVVLLALVDAAPFEEAVLLA